MTIIFVNLDYVKGVFEGFQIFARMLRIQILFKYVSHKLELFCGTVYQACWINYNQENPGFVCFSELLKNEYRFQVILPKMFDLYSSWQ